MSIKDKLIADIIKTEGGYVNDESDSGGETMYGITKKVAVANGYYGAMIDMPKSVAERIYEDKYWNSMMLDVVAGISEKVAAELADTGVNMGVRTASRFFQRGLNALNNRCTLYDDIIVDGYIGTGTVAAFRKYMLRRGNDGEVVLLKILNCLQGEKYIRLAEGREKDEKFIYGWFMNRV